MKYSNAYNSNPHGSAKRLPKPQVIRIRNNLLPPTLSSQNRVEQPLQNLLETRPASPPLLNLGRHSQRRWSHQYKWHKRWLGSGSWETGLGEAPAQNGLTQLDLERVPLEPVQQCALFVPKPFQNRFRSLHFLTDK